jgi:hypothetical protein
MDYYVPAVAKASAEYAKYNGDYESSMMSKLKSCNARLEVYKLDSIRKWHSLSTGWRHAIIVALKAHMAHRDLAKSLPELISDVPTKPKQTKSNSLVQSLMSKYISADTMPSPSVLHVHLTNMDKLRSVISLRKKVDRLSLLANRKVINMNKAYATYMLFSACESQTLASLYRQSVCLTNTIAKIPKKRDTAHRAYIKGVQYIEEVFSPVFMQGDCCPICIQDGDNLVPARCGHLFHPMCIIDYIHYNLSKQTSKPYHGYNTAQSHIVISCPMCRKKKW